MRKIIVKGMGVNKIIKGVFRVLKVVVGIKIIIVGFD